MRSKHAYGATTENIAGFLFPDESSRDELGNIVRWYGTNTELFAGMRRGLTSQIANRLKSR
jgi:hypothetical protein